MKTNKEIIDEVMKEETRDSPITWKRMNTKPHELCKCFMNSCMENIIEKTLTLKEAEEIRFLEELRKLIFAMQQSRDCFGYNPHKVFTTNLIYKYNIEEPQTIEDKRLLDFAMGCYQNGWLEALNKLDIIDKRLQELKNDK